MIDIDELEVLAKKATSGPWKQVAGYKIEVVSTGTCCASAWARYTYEPDAEITSKQAQINASYIAAVNPAVVLELIAELRHEREKYKYATIRYQEECDVRDWLAQHFGKIEKCKTCKEFPDDIVTINDCIQCIVEYARKNVEGKED